MDIRKRKNLNSKICPHCEHRFTVEDLVPPFIKFEKMFGYYELNFYGGNVKYFTKLQCKCGQWYYIYWNKNNNGLYVKDIEPFDEVATVQDTEQVTKQDTKEKVATSEQKINDTLPLITLGQFTKLTKDKMYLYLKQKYGAKVATSMTTSELSTIFKECANIKDYNAPKTKTNKQDVLEKPIAKVAEV